MTSATGLIIDSIGGQCPTQAEGTMDGNPFYFRARHGFWTLDIAQSGHDPVLSAAESLLHLEGEDSTQGFMQEVAVRKILADAMLRLRSGQ